ncbi:MAG TPA: hypothetical protein VGM39_13340 [Kofleriaceae bacterium]|jgi:hypothetical protein
MTFRITFALAACALVGCTDSHAIGSAPAPLAPARWAISMDDGVPGYDFAYTVAFAPDEDVVASGVSGANGVDCYSWITKRARIDGSERWTKKLTAPGANGVNLGAHAIAVAPDSSVIFATGFTGTIDIAGTKVGPGRGALIGKFTSTGELAWVHTFGASSSLGFTEVAVDEDGQIFASGAFSAHDTFDTPEGLFGSDGGTGVVMAFDAAGEYRWTRQFPTELGFRLGAAGDLVSVTNIDGRTTIHGQTVDSRAASTPIQVRMMRDGAFADVHVLGLDEVAESPVGYAVEADGRIAMASVIDPASLAESSTSISMSKPDGKRLWTRKNEDGHTHVDTAALAPNGDVMVAGHFADPTRELGSGSTLGAIFVRIHDASSGAIVSSQTFGSLEWNGESVITSIATSASGDVAFGGTVDEAIDFGSGAVGTDAPPNTFDNRAAVIGVFGD